jgi:hypothetical protein
MRFSLILAATAAACSFAAFSAGEYYGRETAPLDSELATAQVLTGDSAVRWAGYGCGNDGATLVTRDMPDLSECREVRLLSDSASFPAPGERR